MCRWNLNARRPGPRCVGVQNSRIRPGDLENSPHCPDFKSLDLSYNPIVDRGGKIFKRVIRFLFSIVFQVLGVYGATHDGEHDVYFVPTIARHEAEKNYAAVAHPCVFQGSAQRDIFPMVEALVRIPCVVLNQKDYFDAGVIPLLINADFARILHESRTGLYLLLSTHGPCHADWMHVSGQVEHIRRFKGKETALVLLKSFGVWEQSMPDCLGLSRFSLFWKVIFLPEKVSLGRLSEVLHTPEIVQKEDNSWAGNPVGQAKTIANDLFELWKNHKGPFEVLTEEGLKLAGFLGKENSEIEWVCDLDIPGSLLKLKRKLMPK